jgi:hypothetical protein
MSLQFYVFWLRSLVSRHSRERQFTMGLKQSLEIAKIKHALLVNKKTGNMLFDEDVQEAIHSQFDLLLGCLPVIMTDSLKMALRHSSFFDNEEKKSGKLFYQLSKIENILHGLTTKFTDVKITKLLSKLFRKSHLYDYTDLVNEVIDKTIEEIVHNSSIEDMKPNLGYYITGFHLGFSILCDFHDEIWILIDSNTKVSATIKLYCDFASTAARYSIMYHQKNNQFHKLALSRFTFRPKNQKYLFDELAELKIQHERYTNLASKVGNEILLSYFRGPDDPIVIAMRQLRELYTIPESTL